MALPSRVNFDEAWLEAEKKRCIENNISFSTDNDLKINMLVIEADELLAAEHWGLYRNKLYDIAALELRNGHPDLTIQLLLLVCYLDFGEFSKCEACFPPGILEALSSCLKYHNAKISDYKECFYSFNNNKIAKRPAQAWPSLVKALKQTKTMTY